MTFIFKHKLSNAAVTDLLNILNTLRPGCVPRSKYFIEKIFMTEQDVKQQFFCQDCKTYLGTHPDEGSICQTCNAVFCKESYIEKGCYFLTSSVGEQLRTLFEGHDLFDYIIKDRVGSSNVQDIISGKMYAENLDFLQNPDNISFTFNTDGVPVFTSSNFSVWPLYLQINEVTASERSNFTILQGLWFGDEKPTMNCFLMPFVEEMQSLHAYGVHWTGKNGDEHVSKCVCMLSVADSVARASLQGIKQFNGEYGCTFCLHPGVRVEKGNGSVNTYPLSEILPPLRTHEQILADGERAIHTQQAVHGVKEISPLFLLPSFDMAKAWSPDYMHSVLLGVVRQVTNLLFDSGNHLKAFYLGTTVKHCDSILLSLNPPQEISRSPRSITQRSHWKANEWRAFLLIYSLFVFKVMLPLNYWNHWLLLANAVHILLGDNLTRDMISKAELCLYKFVGEFSELYGPENVTFNVHLLTHLAESVRNFGPLWDTSAFYFENENGKLLKLYHGTQHVQTQMMKRFFGLKMTSRFVQQCAKNAPNYVVSILKDIGGNMIPVSCHHDGFNPLGAPTQKLLSQVEKDVLSELCTKRITAQRVYSYKRAKVRGRLITTKHYSNKYKRNNSVIKIDDIYAEVDAIISGKLFCACQELCICTDEMYFLCFEMAPDNAGSQASVDDYSGVSLSSLLTKVNRGRLYAFHPQAVQSKLFHATYSGSNFIVRLPKFEFS